MSVDLHDLRTKLTPEGWAAVVAESDATGKERSEIAREIIHAWALEKIRASILLNRSLEREGISGHERAFK